MDPKKWAQLERLFERALELEPPARAAFLDRECPDEELRAEVHALLKADLQSESFLEASIQNAAAIATDQITPFALGQLVGPYRLIAEIGQGGMGSVYRAVRADDEFQKEVAIKLVRAGFSGADLERRFRSERQILANLEHPYIARLIDGGTTPNGLPYVVMEYVQGQPIHRYCEESALGLPARLKLFTKVCEAVEYAHRNLVIHRDLKPSNILIDSEGTPKLLDFGIAKLLDETSGEPADLTRTEHQMLTPEYASPEQLLGHATSTTSDVYSLGVLLYRLVTADWPYETTSTAPHEVYRAVTEDQPILPSAAAGKHLESGPTGKGKRFPSAENQAASVSPRKWARSLKGDLDNIVLMALRKDPTRRYQSVQALATDIDRYLRRLPVNARPDSATYRATRFFQRHRLAVSAATVALILLVAVVSVFTVRLREERDRARLEAQKANRVSDFLTGLFEVSDPDQARGETITTREILDRGAERVTLELADQPAVQATMLQVMGRVYRSLGLLDAASPLLENAVALQKELSSVEDLVDALNELGRLAEAQGDYPRAEAIHRDALNLAQSLGQPLLTAATQRELAYSLYRQGQYEVAEELYRGVLATRLRLLSDSHVDVADSYGQLATILMERNEFEDSTVNYRRALEIYVKEYGENHQDVATAMGNLANVLRFQGQYEEPESLHRRSLAIRKKVLGPDHQDYTSSLNNLGVLLHRKGDLDAAYQMFREAVDTRRQRLGYYHPRVAVPLTGLAAVARDRGDLEVAEMLYRESLELHQTTMDEDHPNIAHPMIGLAGVLTGLGRPEEAEPLLAAALSLRRGGLSENHWRIGQSEAALGECLISLGREEEAKTHLENALKIYQLRLKPDDPRTATVSDRLAQLDALDRGR